LIEFTRNGGISRSAAKLHFERSILGPRGPEISARCARTAALSAQLGDTRAKLLSIRAGARDAFYLKMTDAK